VKSAEVVGIRLFDGESHSSESTVDFCRQMKVICVAEVVAIKPSKSIASALHADYLENSGIV
jgi:hypothetical protein